MGIEVVIVNNPGTTSTRCALFSREGVVAEKTIHHSFEELSRLGSPCDEEDLRYNCVFNTLYPLIIHTGLRVVGSAGRGAPLTPLRAGTYRVSGSMLNDCENRRYSAHPSNFGALIAHRFAQTFHLADSYIVDPVTADSLWDVARVSGCPGIVRESRAHVLNIRAVVRAAASELSIPLTDSRFVVAHLGGGTSIAAVEGGSIVDVTDGLLGMGPFSMNRAGALPLRGVISLCYSRPENEVRDLLTLKSGLWGYIGTNDFREALARAASGDREAEKAIEAYAYQTAKEIGAYTAALKGNIHGILITGGCAHSQRLINMLRASVEKFAPVRVYAGEREMEALAAGAFRVIDGIEEALEY
ncbi:MAG: butyrate kinase [Spirochaetota bacterium]